MMGLHAVQGPTGALTVETRLDTLTILVGVVFVGALVRSLLFGRNPVMPGLAIAGSLTRAATHVQPALRTLAGPALLGFALLAPALFYNNRYLLDLSILVLTYVMLGWGLNI